MCGIANSLTASFLAGMLILSCTRSHAQQVASVDDVTQYKQAYPDALFITPHEKVDQSVFTTSEQKVRWSSRPFIKSNTRYIQFRFDQIHSPIGLNYFIRIVNDSTGSIVGSYPASEFAKEDSFITGLLVPGSLHAEVYSDENPTGLSFELERVLWQAASPNVQVQSPVISFALVQKLPAGDPALHVADAISLVHIGPTATTCTGFLVSDSIVVTNYHCLKYSLSFLQSEQTDQPSCADILVEFDYLSLNQRGVAARCLGVYAHSEMDAALLTLDPQKILMQTGQKRQPIQLRPDDLEMPAKVSLIQHPLGMPLSIVEGCQTKGVVDPDVLHSCDSAPGSSGSPLVDDEMRLVGLHYKAAYPDSFTFAQAYQDYMDHGPRYNHAKNSAAVAKILGR